ncbi:hypothetical protein CEG14_05530 [Bordetella genomosp. 1]|uniref:Uncharacterized protein n=1 Tax=Bordetella genomosp. 1 TaxID=1395607 RepID=A0A261SPR1_9BORD|nr:hypothetical protein [Bordetella genomosp. 1]OZI38997.1 hypothetical protein CEG14_05530 [Bordetella genomosp. 1]
MTTNSNHPAIPAGEQDEQPELAVWYGSMPESNGKHNWTAMLYRKGDGLMGGVTLTLDRSEYPDRVRYEADRARFLIGELPNEPFILDYDGDLRSEPHCPPPVAAPAAGDAREVDPLQGAANWLVQAHSQPCPTVLSACLMIGYNRAQRLYDAAIAAEQGEGGAA